MKKQFFTALLLLATVAGTAQVAVVKEAKSAKSDPEKAAQLILPALSDPTTANDPQTWKLAGDFQKAIYDAENMKLFLPTGAAADTAKLYNSLLNLFEYYQKADQVEQKLVQEGALKKAKLRKGLASELAKVRPNLTNAGSDAFNAGQYERALKFFSLYVDAVDAPIFENETAIKEDTLTALIANYAALAAVQTKNNAATLKYAKIGKDNKEEGYRGLMCMAEVYKEGELKDSVQWLATIQEGVEKFPQQEYFIGNLMDYYIQHGKIQEGLTQMDKVLATNPSPYFMYVKGVLQYEAKEYDNARTTFQAIIDANKEFVAESYEKMGASYFFVAQELVEANSTIPMNDPRFEANEKKIKDLYVKALPFYEKAKELKPDNNQLWGQYLLNIYWKLDKAKYEALEKELGY